MDKKTYSIILDFFNSMAPFFSFPLFIVTFAALK